MKVGTGERTAGPLSRANFHVYRDNVSPLRGEKPIFGPVSKYNIGMAALRAGLPVIIKYYTVIIIIIITSGSETTTFLKILDPHVPHNFYVAP